MGPWLAFLISGLAAAEEPHPGTTASSSSLIYDPLADRLYAANADSGTLSILDAGSFSLLAEIPVGRDPRSVALGPGGREAFVPGRRDGTLTAVSTSAPHRARQGRAGVEPWCILWASEAASLILTDRSAGDVLWVSPDTFTVTRRLRLGRQPTALARAGARLFVGHFHGGKVSEVDAARGEVLREIPLRPDAGLVRSFAVEPDSRSLYVPHTRFFTGAEDLLFDTMVFPAVAEIDLAAGRVSRTIHLDAVDRPENDPVAAALAPDGRLLVLHSGSETLTAIDLRTPQGAAAGRVELGRNPWGLAVDEGRRLAYVENRLSGDLSAVDLDRMEEVRRVEVTRSPLPERLQNGMRIFHDARSARVTLDRWMSCATCHPDGESCGRTWRYQIGRRNVPALFGAARTGPLFWSGTRDEIEDFEWAFRKFQAGRGLLLGPPFPDLGPPNHGLSRDLDDLALYISSLEPPPSAFRGGDGSYPAAALRGRAIFFSEKTGCLKCHPPPLYTDSLLEEGRPRLHDVGTGDAPEEKLGPAFDAPSLVDLEHSAPYLHDGRAPEIVDVLVRHNLRDRHGRTSHLKEEEISDLAAFLGAIPLVRPGEILDGDIDLDGRIGPSDLERARAALRGEVPLSEAALQNFDLDRNGVLDSRDLGKVARLVEGEK